MRRAKLTKDENTEPKRGQELAAALRRDGFKIVDKTIDELEKLVKEPCQIVGDSTSGLTAKLAESVVIEAIIRFSIGNHRLDTKFMTLVRLASSRSRIGYSAEYYTTIVTHRAPGFPFRISNQSSPRKYWDEQYESLV